MISANTEPASLVRNILSASENRRIFQTFRRMALMSSLVFSFLAAAAFFPAALLLLPRRARAAETMATPTGVLMYDKEKAQDGYTLISPMQSTSSYLLDMEGNVVHEWKTDGLPGLYAELLPDGNLLRGIRYEKKVPFGGVAGGVQAARLGLETWCGSTGSTTMTD